MYTLDFSGQLKVCYQVKVQFIFNLGKPALVSTALKKVDAAAFLVSAGLPFGSVLKYSRYFSSEQEAAQYITLLHAVYKNRIISQPANPNGQLSLF
ncbi:MAG: hypothetical protein LBR98_08305 [Syntrophomonadaceae bacterium]|jgi:hypothetical protein|nr:hypothetical protein [Syntrophomonadaceae bacterium]